MGIAQGTEFYRRWQDPEVAPDWDAPPKYDPMIGFEKGRKERVMIATVGEMDNAKLSAVERDYCAHKLIKLRKCMHLNTPYHWYCNHEKHDYQSCEHEDYTLRVMEYEREKRLMMRDKRKALLLKEESGMGQ